MNIRIILTRLFIAIIAVAGLNIGNSVPAHAVDAGQTVAANQATDQMPDVDAKSKATKVKRICAKAPGTFTTTNNITVVTNKLCFDVKILKKMGCDTEAGKIERPAPPRDPKSRCKGKAMIHFKVDYKTQCPPSWIGGSLKLYLNIKQRVDALGLSKSIASGRVDTWAKTHINLKDKFKIRVSNDCVFVPVVETYDECPDIPGDQPKGYVCSTPPPPPVTPTYSCDTLSVAKGDNRTVTIGGFSTSQSGGATFKNVLIEWGDGSSDRFTSAVGKTHKYGSDASYTIKATAVFDVNGQEVPATSNGCIAAVSFTTTPPPVAKPTLLPDTVNHTLVNQFRTVSTGGSVASGHTASLKAWAVVGTISGSNPQTVSGNFSGKSVGYTAPGEVPASMTYTGPDGQEYTLPDGKDVIWWTLTQDDGQTVYARVQVVIDPRPTTPEVAQQ